VSGIAKEDVIILIDGDAKKISIAPAPSFDRETDGGALSYGKKLIEGQSKGTLNDSYAAVVAGKGAEHSRFGIINSLFFDQRRKRIRAKQAGRGGTGTVMRVKGLRGIIVRSNLPKANGNNAVEKEMVRAAGETLKSVISKCDAKQLNLGAWGTTGLSEYMNNFHLFPTD
jgi:aldehyde:ferredoxin oxidoreductase